MTRTSSIRFITAVLSLGTLAAQNPSTVDGLLESIVRNEREFLARLRGSTPIIETYIQEVPAPGEAPRNDHYYLGRMSLGESIGYEPLIERSEASKRSRFLARGFAQMTLLDSTHFNRQTYRFDYVRREFLGDVRCLVFDIAPHDPKSAGRFIGRVWVEDRENRIVRFNGSYTAAKNSRWNFLSTSEAYFHFDSWRVNIAPGHWAPAYVYVEEAGETEGKSARASFKAQTRLWGYNVASGGKLDELTSILVESNSSVQDSSGSKDVSPLESQRSWERQAEENMLDRLQKSGLLAPAGEVDKVLNTVVNNLIVTNNLNVDVVCRVLLTTPLETFSIGHTIVISRGLIDVLPDEASLAMMLAQELAHIALGHGTETQFAFHNRTMLSDSQMLQSFRFQRPQAELAAAGRKTVEYLSKSPYAQKLGNAGLFLKALANRAPSLPMLIHANLGNQLGSGETSVHLNALAVQGPALVAATLDQIAALPLGSRVKVDPWSNAVTLVKAKPVSLLSAREKMPFEVSPFVIHLTRQDRSLTVAAQ